MSKKLIPLEGKELQRTIEELESIGKAPKKTIEGLKSGIYFIDKDLRIWDENNTWVKGTSKIGGSPYTRRSDHFDMRKVLNIFDETVKPRDWVEILANWKEVAKTDYVAAKALFETRFGKAPSRQHILLETKDLTGELDTAYSRTRDRLSKLRRQVIDVTPDDEGHEVLDYSPYNQEEDLEAPKIKVRRKLLRE